MAQLIHLVIFSSLLPLVVTLTYRYDFSSGLKSNVAYTCPGRTDGWFVEKASNYSSPPSGALTGQVVTSRRSSCMKTTGTVRINSKSSFLMLVRVPYYVSSLERMQVFLIAKNDSAIEWLNIQGPTQVGKEWFEIVKPLTTSMVNLTGDFKVEIWATSSNQSISIRYFEVTDVAIVTTTTKAVTTTTSKPTTPSTTTTSKPTTTLSTTTSTPTTTPSPTTSKPTTTLSTTTSTPTTTLSPTTSTPTTTPSPTTSKPTTTLSATTSTPTTTLSTTTSKPTTTLSATTSTPTTTSKPTTTLSATTSTPTTTLSTTTSTPTTTLSATTSTPTTTLSATTSTPTTTLSPTTIPTSTAEMSTTSLKPTTQPITAVNITTSLTTQAGSATPSITTTTSPSFLPDDSQFQVIVALAVSVVTLAALVAVAMVVKWACRRGAANRDAAVLDDAYHHIKYFDHKYGNL